MPSRFSSLRCLARPGVNAVAAAAIALLTAIVVVVGARPDSTADALVLVLGSSVVSAAVAWLMIERLMMRHVRRLRDAAIAMAGGEYGRRVEISAGPQEIRELGAAFNGMTARLEKLALHDQLTGLPNRRFLTLTVDEFIRRGKPFALMAVDLDCFKPVNDTHGHAMGDRVLVDVAYRLRTSVNGEGFVARIGGDEFIVAVPLQARTSRQHAAVQADRLLDSLADPFGIGGSSVVISASVGVALWPEDAPDFTALLRNVDVALYRAKEAGRNRRALYAPQPCGANQPADISRTAAA